MPLTFISGQLVQFAHVPRCGGTSVEKYLYARFGKLGFLDRQHNQIPSTERWSNTSPQHLEAAALDRLIPSEWVVHRFALVRHPEDRVISAFCFQRDIEGAIPHATDFHAWIADLPARCAADPHYLDNHLRPASELIPRGTTIFGLENGMEAVVTWLDGIDGTQRGPRRIEKFNAYAARLDHVKQDPGPLPEITPRAREIIAEMYAADFERFDYEPRRTATTGT